jgi:hypothetical protein
MLVLLLCDSQVNFSIDTGAKVNIIDKKTFENLKTKPKLSNTNCGLFPYGSRN